MSFVSEWQKANLRKLADYLMTHVPPPHFHMGTYVSTVEFGTMIGGVPVEEWIKSQSDLANAIYSNGISVMPSDTRLSKVHDSCGTVACALGHGPLAGIRVPKGMDWERYADDAFGAPRYANSGRGELYAWLFHPDWLYVDNTPQGAAKRIYYYLQFGLPDDTSPYVHKNARDEYEALLEKVILPIPSGY